MVLYINEEKIILNNNIEKILSDPIEIGVSYSKMKSDELVVLNNENIFINYKRHSNEKTIKLKISSIGKGLKVVNIVNYRMDLEIEIGTDVAVYLSNPSSFEYRIKIDEGGFLYSFPTFENLFNKNDFFKTYNFKKGEWRWYTRKKGELKEYNEEEWIIKGIIE